MNLRSLLILGLAASALGTAGCGNGGTNEPSQSAVEKANADRAAAIDNDPKLSQEQKDTMKKMMGLGPKDAQTQGR